MTIELLQEKVQNIFNCSLINFLSAIANNDFDNILPDELCDKDEDFNIKEYIDENICPIKVITIERAFFNTDEQRAIFKINNDYLLMITGYYSSWTDTDYDEISIVKEVKKTVKDYKIIKSI